MQIATDTVVAMDYTLKNAKGDVLDSSDGGGPLEYLQGHGNIIPGLETQMEGKQVGDSFAVVIGPEEGYGQPVEELVQTVPRTMFPEQVELDMQFQVMSSHGPRIVRVVNVTDQEVTVDANHPLAGQELHFQVDVRDVREATDDELTHGHPHSMGGCCSSPKEEAAEDACCGGGGCSS